MADPANKKLQAWSSNRIRFDSMGNEDVYSVPREIGPSAAAADATDQETLARLRAETKVWNTEKAGQGFVTLEGNCQFLEWHPSQLPSCFFLRKPPLFFLNKPPQAQGSWERKEGCRIAIRSDGVSRSHIPCRPDYIGMKSFFEFRLHGTKTDWLMVEYRLFDHCFVVDDLVLCKVFELKRKGLAPSGDAAAPLPNQVPLHPTMSASSPTRPEICFDDIEKFLSDFDFNDHNIGVPGPLSEHTGLSIEDNAAQGFNVDASSGLPSSGREGQHWENKEPVVPNEVQLVRKRSRSSGNGKSDVWNYFTKIRSKDHNEVYATCHYCDQMLKAHPKKDGTSHLSRHTEKCSGKMRLNQPS